MPDHDRTYRRGIRQFGRGDRSRSRRFGIPGHGWHLYRAALDICYEAFDVRRAQLWTSQFARWCGDQPELVAYSGQSHAYRAQLFLLHGEWAEASAAANLAHESLRAGDFTAAYVANYQLAELHRLRGETAAAEEYYRRAGETGWDPQPGLALVRLARGEPKVAPTMIRNSVAVADEATRRRLLPAQVQIEVSVGDVDVARRAAAELVALEQSAPTPMLAALARFAEAQVLFAEGDASGAFTSAGAALSKWAMLDVPYEEARCHALRSRVLVALGQLDAGNADLEAASAAFQELGAPSGLAEITVDRPRTTLTVREVEVLRLVSTGLTNRGIATRLSLSEKTVARHLSNIFGKLGLSSCAAATAYAYEHGVI